MHIQIDTDHNVHWRETLANHVSQVVGRALDRYGELVTRVDVHLSDQNCETSGHYDKRCMMEARLSGRRPTAVTHQAATLDQAVDGAAAKLRRCLESTIDLSRLPH